MDLSVELLPSAVNWIAHVLAALLIGHAVLTAPWRRLEDTGTLHVILGSAVGLLLLWSLKAGIEPGLGFHLLGGTLLTLMFGWQFALLVMTLVIAGITFNGTSDWPSLSANLLLLAAVPVGLTHLLYRFAVRYLPHTFFTYVLVNAYLCGGLAMGASMLAVLLLLVCCSPYSLHYLVNEFLPFSPLMMFAEAFFTGMLAAAMALFRPEWIWTFDDRRYLAGK